MILSSPWVKLGGVFLVGVGGFFVGWNWNGARYEAEKQQAIAQALAEREKHYVEEQAKADAIGRSAEQKLANLEAENRAQARRLDYAISKNAAFGSCTYGPDGVRAINDTIDAFGGETPGESAP